MQAKDHDELFYMAELHRMRGLLKLARSPGAVKDADADILQALEIARRQGARALELRAAMSRHELLLGQGRGAESRPALQAVFSTFTEGFELPDLTKARELLSQAP
jgi:predicted ATPase